MGISLAIFKIVGNIPVEKDKLIIVARYLDIWSLTRCKILVGILLGPQDLLLLRNDIILQISSLFVAVITKESLFFADKKLLNDLFENLIFDWTVSAIDVKKFYSKILFKNFIQKFYSVENQLSNNNQNFSFLRASSTSLKTTSLTPQVSRPALFEPCIRKNYKQFQKIWHVQSFCSPIYVFFWHVLTNVIFLFCLVFARIICLSIDWSLPCSILMQLFLKTSLRGFTLKYFQEFSFVSVLSLTCKYHRKSSYRFKLIILAILSKRNSFAQYTK